jgi:hypothetical protein
MTTLVPVVVSPLRQLLIDEMDLRRFGRETQRNYICDVGRFARRRTSGASRSNKVSSTCRHRP